MTGREKAEQQARAAMADLEAVGNSFKDGSFETITKAFWYGLDADRIAAFVDGCIAPRGIEMPWGIRVTP